MKNYEYKNSGIEWLGDIPKHWKRDKLFRLAENVGSGGTPKSSNESYYGGEIAWIQSGDLTDSFVSETAKTITQEGLSNSSAKIFPKGTLLVAMYGATIGKLGIMEMDAAINQACCAIQFSTKIHSKFSYYLLLDMRNFLITQSYGGGQPNISQEIIKQRYLFYPPFAEQKAIAEYLDRTCEKIDRIISIKEKQLEKVASIRYSVIYKACVLGIKNHTDLVDVEIGHIKKYPSHWRVRKVKRGCERIDTGGTPTSSKSEYFENGTIEWFAPECIGEGLNINTPKKLINIKAVEDNEIKIYCKNSVFFVGVGATAGKVGVINKPSSCNQQINILKTNYQLVPAYLAYQLKILEKEIVKFAQYATLPIINQAKTGYIEVVFPPVSEQIEIVEYLENYSKKLLDVPIKLKSS